MKILKIIKKYQFYLFFFFSACFLLIFYFSTSNYLNNLPQNLNYVDVTPNDQKKEDPEFHSFLADSYRSWGVYNLQADNQIVFNGNLKHLLHYNMPNLELKVWKNETINAQLILIKRNANKTFENVTVTTSQDASITIDTKFMDFINARKNRNNSFITSFNQHIADWIKTDTNQSYNWTNHIVLPVWITIKADEAGSYPIDINLNIDNKVVKHTINLIVSNHLLPNLKDQTYYNLDLWQKFNNTASYYQQYETEPIITGSETYFKYLDPYLTHLGNIGEEIFNFEIMNQFLKIKYENNNWKIDFDQDSLNNYLKTILSYGFKGISFLSVDYLFNYQNFKTFANDWNLNENEIKNGFNTLQKTVLDYFDGSSWYDNQKPRPNIYVNYDELSPDDFQKGMDELEKLQGNKKVFAIAADVNYDFWTSNKAIEIFKKIDRLSVSYAYLNYLDTNSYNKVLSLVNFREKEGKFTSIYSCTGDYPGNFIKSQPGESTFIPLVGLKFNIHNFLRWSYNIWPQDWIDGKGIVESDDPSTLLESGDWYSVYPYQLDKDNNPLNNFLSPRIQLLVYGQEQAIKLEILKQKGQADKVKNIIDKIQQIFWPDAFQPDWNLFTRNHGKNTSVDKQLNLIINELNKL